MNGIFQGTDALGSLRRIMGIVLPDEILKYEDEGLLLTPCKPDKTPAYRGWQELASARREEHERWFAETTLRLLPGLLTGERNGIVVVDCDEKEIGRVFFKQFRERIRTIVETPRGIHFYFAQPDQEIRNRVNAAIGGVVADVRSSGGFVICPPANTERGGYRFVDGYGLDPKKLEVFDLSWIQEKPKKWEPVEESDLLRRYARARAWLAHRPAAVSGQSGHKTMFAASCGMFSKFGLTPELAWAALLEYNARAEPPFSEKELRHKWIDAQEKSDVQR